jgi:hypothetical protein
VTIKILLKTLLRKDTYFCLLGPGLELGRNNQGRSGHCGYRGRGHPGHYCRHQHWSQVILLKKITTIEVRFTERYRKVFHGQLSLVAWSGAYILFFIRNEANVSHFFRHVPMRQKLRKSSKFLTVRLVIGYFLVQKLYLKASVQCNVFLMRKNNLFVKTD